jgi:hypothetical protein
MYVPTPEQLATGNWYFDAEQGIFIDRTALPSEPEIEPEEEKPVHASEGMLWNGNKLV